MSYRTKSLFFSVVLAATTISHASTLKIGFFPDHIFHAQVEKTGLYQEVVFFKQIGQTLVESGPANELIPGLAESWTVSEDKLKYTFKLRHGVKFHDGSPVTVYDVESTLNRVMYSDQNTFHLYMKDVKYFEEGKALKKCRGIVVRKPDEIEIQLSAPFAPLLKILTTGYVVVLKPQVENRPAIGSGPYKIMPKPGGYYLEKYVDYIGPYPPKIDKIELVVNSDYLYGKKPIPLSELPDYDEFIPHGQQGLYSQKEYTITRSPNLGTTGFYTNIKSQNCKTLKQRQSLLALMYFAAQKMSKITQEKIPGSPLSDVFPRGMLAYRQNRPALLKLENTFQEKLMKDLPSTIVLAATGQILGDTEAFLAEAAKHTKSKISIKQLNVANAISEIEFQNYDVILLTWHSLVADPYSQISIFDLMRSLNGSIAKRVRKSLAIEDDHLRAVAYDAIADQIFEEALFVPIYQRDRICALRNTLQISNFLYRYQTMFSEISFKDKEVR